MGLKALRQEGLVGQRPLHLVEGLQDDAPIRCERMLLLRCEDEEQVQYEQMCHAPVMLSVTTVRLKKVR